MIISDLTYLETISEVSSLHGGTRKPPSPLQANSVAVLQIANASARGGFVNVAFAFNNNVVVPINIGVLNGK